MERAGDLRRRAHALAEEVLAAASQPWGIAGAAPRSPAADSEQALYDALWTRDAMISGFAALVDERFLPALDASLRTLVNAMDPCGQIPKTVVPQTGEVRWRGTGDHPASDATYWVIIATCLRWLTYPHIPFVETFRPALDRMVGYILSREETHENLPIAQPRCTWVDLLYLGEGRLLHLAVLHAYALDLYAALLKHSGAPVVQASAYEARAAATRQAIRETFLLDEPVAWPAQPTLHDLPRQHARVALGRLPYLIASRGQFDEFVPHCDVPSNLLAYIWGIADVRAAARFFDFVQATGLAHPYPIQVLEPPILPGDESWRAGNSWRGLNLAPYQYHNGGAWPWVGGLWVEFCIRLKRDLAEASDLPDEPAIRRAAEQIREPGFVEGELDRLAAAVLGGSDGRVPCPEWLHGLTGRSQGVERQTWTAARYLVAEAVLRQPDALVYRW